MERAKKICSSCKTAFILTESDWAFLEKMGVPEPSFCPRCRSIRRLQHINQIHLFVRKCDGTGQRIISNFPPDSACKVFSQEHWYSDAHEGCDYGRPFDFNRPFFEQFHELSLEVPRPALFTDYTRDENCAYTNQAGKNKNCYLIFDSDENRDCYYCYGLNHSRDSVDCYRVHNLELCYHVVDSNNCYHCAYAVQCENCTDCILVRNCLGCKNCIMCSNLRQKQYYFMNQPVSKEEFFRIRERFSSSRFTEEKINEFDAFRMTFPDKAVHGYQNENVRGNHLVFSKNAQYCFDSLRLWDTKYCYQMFIRAKNCMDCDECGEAELLYDCAVLAYNIYNCRFSLYCFNQVSNLTYCAHCYMGCSNLFGCFGLKRKEYCILNKQYSKEEYLSLMQRIIDHMKSTGEWGEFFPASCSPFPYNLTQACDLYPLSREQALEQGYRWREADQREYQPQTAELPDRVEDLPETIVNEVLVCEACSKNYKLIPQEVRFYKDNLLSPPRQCFYCRHSSRTAGRTPRNLWRRDCDRCSNSISTAYSPKRKELIYCEPCYLETLS